MPKNGKENNTMVVLPIEFVPTRYPGYFWNTETQTLYSVKVSGELKELAITNPSAFSRITEPGYRVSVKGVRKFMAISRLKKLKASTDVQVFPVKGRYGS